MRTRALGGRQVCEIGLGGMPMSIEGRPDRARSVATIHAALDAGVTLIDTADSYHIHPDEVGHNETLIARAVAAGAGTAPACWWRPRAGTCARGDGSWTLNGSPEHLKRACEASLRRLGVDAIGLYQFHRPDPDVRYPESIGALKELHDAGKIQLVGVSNADPASRFAGQLGLSPEQLAELDATGPQPVT